MTRDPSISRASQIGEASSNSAADLADDALTYVHQLSPIAETNVCQLYPAADFDEATRGSVDHDVGDVVSRQQRLQRAETQDIVADIIEQVLLLRNRKDQIFIVTIS